MSGGEHSHLDHLHELASLYALDALEGADHEQFEAHLRGGCPTCENDVKLFRTVAGALGGSTPAEPPAALRDRLLSRVAGSKRVPGTLLHEQGLLISRPNERPWRRFSPGIESKVLFNDKERKYTTLLVRMEAGAQYPSHRHRDVEELFVLSGDLRVAGQVMQAGDYCRADPDSIHEVTSSESGCVFLLMASQKDEVLEAG